MLHSILSSLFVIIQFSCIAALVSYNLKADTPQLLALIILGAGIGIGLSALWEMRRSSFSIFPDIRKNATLVRTGIYSLIRHPMYLAVIVSCFGLFINNIRISTGIIFFVLVINMIIKLHFEEFLLVKKFPEYREYKEESKRIIPFVY